jgi:hypothetical protein
LKKYSRTQVDAFFLDTKQLLAVSIEKCFSKRYVHIRNFFSQIIHGCFWPNKFWIKMFLFIFVGKKLILHPKNEKTIFFPKNVIFFNNSEFFKKKRSNIHIALTLKRLFFLRGNTNFRFETRIYDKTLSRTSLQTCFK